jgi:hypothetical protein
MEKSYNCPICGHEIQTYTTTTTTIHHREVSEWGEDDPCECVIHIDYPAGDNYVASVVFEEVLNHPFNDKSAIEWLDEWGFDYQQVDDGDVTASPNETYYTFVADIHAVEKMARGTLNRMIVEYEQ